MKLSNRVNNDLLRNVLDKANIYYWRYDVQKDICYSGYRSIQEFQMPEIVENAPFSFAEQGFIHPDSIEDYLQLHLDMKKGLPYSEKNIRMSNRFNNACWYHVKITNSFDKAGKPTIALAIANEISDYKNLEECFNFAIQHEGMNIWTYDFATDTIRNDSNGDSHLPYGTISNVPDSIIDSCTIHPDDIKEFRAMFNRLKTNGDNLGCIIRVYNKTNSDYDWMHITYSLLYDQHGKPIKAMGTSKNINEKMEAEEKSRVFQTYQRMALSNTLMSCRLNLTTNRCGDFQSAKRHFLVVTKDSTVDSFFEGVCQHINEDDLGKFTKIFGHRVLLSAYFRGETSVSTKFRYHPTRNSVRWIKMTCEMTENPNTHQIEGMLYAHDIHKEKTLQLVIEQLVGVDYEFIATLNFLNDEVTLFAKDKKDIWCSPSEEEPYSTSHDAIIKAYVKSDYQEEAVAKMSVKAIKKALKVSKVYNVTFPVINSDGEEEYKTWRYFYVDDDHKACIFTRTDVTDIINEQKKQQRNLEEALKVAEEANLAKTDFLSRMSHDMRTPMNGILGLINLSNEEPMSPSLKDNLQKMQSSGKYLLNIINDILDMSKIESNNITLKIETVNPKEFLESLLAAIKPAIVEKNIDLQVSLEQIMFDYINIDPVRTQQTLLNILSNAIKFTPNDGKIEFLAERMRIDDDKFYDCITIRDNGVGISPKFLPNIYDLFAQEDNEINTQYAGTGLGMPIVKRLVELMNGSIEIKSELNKGTEVKIFLPITKGKCLSDESQETFCDQKSLRGRKILLCEDNHLNSEIARRLLEMQGCVVDIAANGKIGLDKFIQSKKNYYDLILMDIRMPEMDGIDATKAIRALPRCDARQIPIIAMTANAYLEDKLKSQEAGMNAHIAKPFDPQQLFNVINEMIELKNKGLMKVDFWLK